MTSSKPYLIRAMFDWIVDNDYTPHIVVNADAQGVQVPEEYIEDGKIILNIAPRAVRDYQMTNDWITFDARFAGAALEIHVPTHAVLAIYAQENGRGMVFNEDEEFEGDDDDHPPTSPTGRGGKGKPNLRVVK